MYDVIIVGAGPAGTCAALYCHRQGLKTLLLDKSQFPRDKTCGDALSGKSVKVLDDLGLISGVDNLNGSITLPNDLPIFWPSLVKKPWPKTEFGISIPADINIAGQ